MPGTMTLMMMMMQKQSSLHPSINHLPFLGVHLREDESESGRKEGRREALASNHNRRCHSGRKSALHKGCIPFRQTERSSFSSQRVNMSKLCDIEVRQRYLGRIDSNCLWGS